MEQQESDSLRATESQRATKVDRFGAVASSLCALHCVVCALAPAIFGSIGLGFLLSQSTELTLTFVAVLFAAAALILSWRIHRSVLVTGLLSVGIVSLLASRALEMNAHHDHHDHNNAHHDHHESEHSEDHHQTEHPDSHQDQAIHNPDKQESEHLEASASGNHHDESEEDMHLLGASVGFFGGLTLLFGHIFNIRNHRRCREDNETSEGTAPVS